MAHLLFKHLLSVYVIATTSLLCHAHGQRLAADEARGADLLRSLRRRTAQASADPIQIRLFSLTDASGNEFSISEWSQMGTVLGLVQVIGRDPDVGVFCSVDSSMVSLVRLTPDEMKLILSGHLDREREASVTFTLRCSDGRSEARQHATILVRDVNDNSPRFPDNEFFVTVREGAQVGTVVGQVTARDRDEGENARITYTLDPPNNGLVEIDSDSGVLLTVSVPDRGSVGSLSLRVVATDHGQPPRSSTARLNIDVLDARGNQ